MSKELRILSRPRGNAEEYGRWSVNPVVGCPHGCKYCYLKKGAWKNKLGGSEPSFKMGIVNDKHAYHLFAAEVIEHRDEIIGDGGLFMSFVTDPMCEQNRDLFWALIAYATSMDIPVTVLTKSTGVWENELYKVMAGGPNYPPMKRLVALGWTLTGHDELEIGAPGNWARLRDMDTVRHDGYMTWASIEPVIDFGASLNMVYGAVNAGCRHFKIGLLTSNTRVCKSRYDVRACIHFIEDVMRVTDGHATVYWKKSVRELLGDSSGDIIDHWPHSVGMDWNMFDSKIR